MPSYWSGCTRSQSTPDGWPSAVFVSISSVSVAIQWSADGPYVWVAEDGRAAQVPVRIVQRNNDAVLVQGDLAPGTRVVTQGVQLLRAGAPFRFEGDDSEIQINPPPGGHKAEFDEWDWRPMRELPGLVVPFKRKVYEEVVAAFSHLVR